MCGRFSLTTPVHNVMQFFDCRGEEGFPPRYNIAPAQPIHIVRRGPTGKNELVLVRWGLIPSWVKDPRDFTLILNARCETVLTKPSFRAAMRHHRCLVPANGYYEWTGGKGKKRAWFVRPKQNDIFAFAGLWEHWLGAEGSEIESAAIITTPANNMTASVHPRMPAIIHKENFDLWLDCQTYSAQEAAALLQPASEDFFEIIEVSDLVNNPQNDDVHVQLPLQGSLF